MIGDREYRDNPDEVDGRGPLDAMARLNSPESPHNPADPIGSLRLPPVWVERYDRLIVVRHTFPDGYGPVTERAYPSTADAVRGMAAQIAVLRGRGYTVVAEDLVR